MSHSLQSEGFFLVFFFFFFVIGSGPFYFSSILPIFKDLRNTATFVLNLCIIDGDTVWDFVFFAKCRLAFLHSLSSQLIHLHFLSLLVLVAGILDSHDCSFIYFLKWTLLFCVSGVGRGIYSLPDLWENSMFYVCSFADCCVWSSLLHLPSQYVTYMVMKGLCPFEQLSSFECTCSRAIIFESSPKISVWIVWSICNMHYNLEVPVHCISPAGSNRKLSYISMRFQHI